MADQSITIKPIRFTACWLSIFEILEQLRSKGKARLASLEVFHYCLLLGFQGKYRIESIESLNHLVARVGDEIDYLKGKRQPSHLLRLFPIKFEI